MWQMGLSSPVRRTSKTHTKHKTDRMKEIDSKKIQMCCHMASDERRCYKFNLRGKKEGGDAAIDNK